MIGIPPTNTVVNEPFDPQTITAPLINHFINSSISLDLKWTSPVQSSPVQSRGRWTFPSTTARTSRRLKSPLAGCGL